MAPKLASLLLRKPTLWALLTLALLIVASSAAPQASSDSQADAVDQEQPASESHVELEQPQEEKAQTEPTVVVAPDLESPESAREETEDNSSTTVKPEVQPPERVLCLDETYCLNGGICVMSQNGQMICICPEGFYGERCQTRDICKTVIIESLTGDQICAKIGQQCVKNDKFFRCSCNDDEYFIYSLNANNQAAGSNNNHQPNNPPESPDKFPMDSSTFSYETMIGSRPISPSSSSSNNQNSARYTAECRKIDRCLGVRCRQMSEVCMNGKCECNQDAGYILDDSDGLCKLLDPCQLPTPDGKPICGEAKCLPTFDRDLYRCVCSIGYYPLKVSQLRSSTQCIVWGTSICDVPLLNKCEHICQLDDVHPNKSYKCSCLPGYESGTQPGIDDHQCFFQENSDHQGYNPGLYEDPPNTSNQIRMEYVYKSYKVPRFAQVEASNSSNNSQPTENHDSRLASDSDVLIERELVEVSDRQASPGRLIEDKDYFNVGKNIVASRISAQDRCNMYCDENKICVLEEGSSNSYRCHCDRQGFVSIGDKCLNWCAAAEFSYKVQILLSRICTSFACRPIDHRPTPVEVSKLENRLEEPRKSSWRPTFECDCSSSPLLVQDPETRLCKLDFKAILKPCLPGNVGYIDCVENKNAYCAVLDKSWGSYVKDLLKDLFSDRTVEPGRVESKNKRKSSDSDEQGSSNKSKAKLAEELYTCVCSPDKKFLVDKPRNKMRCVDECDLLNVECGRFNRMCRAATIAANDFGHTSLVRVDSEGVRMNFKRTGCECLPGFNVGPSESVDFTLDDNNPSVTLATPPSSQDAYPSVINVVNNSDSNGDSEHRAKYININSRCLLDYDVVEFHASFKAPSDFDPNWIKIRNLIPPPQVWPQENTPSTKTRRSNDNDQFRDRRGSRQQQVGAAVEEDAANPQVKPVESESNKNYPSVDFSTDEPILRVAEFMRADISEFHKNVVLIATCDQYMATLSTEFYKECVRYRYWLVQKLRNHFVDWRSVINKHLSETFELMDGNIRLRINKCEATVKSLSTETWPPDPEASQKSMTRRFSLDPLDDSVVIDADIDCELTLHSASDGFSPQLPRKVLLEKQLPKHIFVKKNQPFNDNYYLMAPNMLIRRESFDSLAEHRKLFNPCKSDYEYCDKQTKCDMVDTVNFTCTCDYGYTPIGSRDIYFADSRKEVCEDINECMFDVCKELADVATCINEIGDYRCQCNRHYTGDNKRYCTHVCNTIPCKHGKCRLVDDHHAFCECDEGYKEADCSVQDPNVALRKANMIICGSIFTSILLLAITIAISLNSQLKKTKKKLKRLEVANEAAQLFEFSHQQPFRPRMSKVSVCS